MRGLLLVSLFVLCFYDHLNERTQHVKRVQTITALHPFLCSYNWLKEKLKARKSTTANSNLLKRVHLKFISIDISLKMLSNSFILSSSL